LDTQIQSYLYSGAAWNLNIRSQGPLFCHSNCCGIPTDGLAGRD